MATKPLFIITVYTLNKRFVIATLTASYQRNKGTFKKKDLHDHMISTPRYAYIMILDELSWLKA